MNRHLFLSLFALLLSATGCSDLTPPASAAPSPITRYPYLQMALHDSITILWRSAYANPAEVRFRKQGTEAWVTAAANTRPTSGGQTECEAVLYHLSPAQYYEYQLWQNNAPLLPDTFTFRAPLAPTDTSFHFFAVGDIGEPLETEGTPNLLGKALKQSAHRYDLGILMGDIVYPDGQSKDYDANFFRHFEGCLSTTPVYPVLGNHDWHEPEQHFMREWKLPHNEHYYSFQHGNVHFIGLDSGKGGDMYDYENQIQWLKDDLSHRPAGTDWTIVFLHHNGKSCTYKSDEAGVISLYPIFEAHGVDLVLNGHAHTYERLNPMNGAGEVLQPYLQDSTSTYHDLPGFISITAGSGGKLRGVGSDPKAYHPNPDSCAHPNLVAAAHHTWAYLDLEVEGKRLTGRAYQTETLEVLDEFTLVKTGGERAIDLVQ
jgi:hypothetical protein